MEKLQDEGGMHQKEKVEESPETGFHIAVGENADAVDTVGMQDTGLDESPVADAVSTTAMESTVSFGLEVGPFEKVQSHIQNLYPELTGDQLTTCTKKVCQEMKEVIQLLEIIHSAQGQRMEQVKRTLLMKEIKSIEQWLDNVLLRKTSLDYLKYE